MANELMPKQRPGVPIEEKIKIFEEFKDTGEQLTGHTIYKGYPIGQWGVTIRQYRNNMKRGLKNNSYITEDQYKKMEELGYLENLRGIPIDEQIKALIDWKQKYLENDMEYIKIPKEILKRHASSLEEQVKIEEEYKLIRKYYRYVVERKCIGKLTEEQQAKIENGDIGGFLGYSDKIMELAKRFGQTPQDINYIYKKYENTGKFVSSYFQEELDEYDQELAQKMIKNVVDIDLNPNGDAYDRLVSRIYDVDQSQLCLYSSKEIDEVLNKLSLRQRLVIIERFGLQSGKGKSLREISELVGIVGERVRQIEKSVIERLRLFCKENPIDYNFLKDSEWLTEEEKAKIFQLEDMIRNSNILFRQNENEEVASSGKILKLDINVEEYEQAVREIEELKRKAKIRKQTEEYKNLKVLETIPVEELDFSAKQLKVLNKAGCLNLKDIVTSKDKKVLERIKIDNIDGIVAEKKADLQRKIACMGIQGEEAEAYFLFLEDLIEEDNDEIEGYLENIHTEKLGLTEKTYRYLMRAGYDTVSKVLNLSFKDVLQIRGIGVTKAANIMDEIEKSKRNLKDNSYNPAEDGITNYSMLEQLRNEKEELKGDIKHIKSQLPEAKELLSEYDRMLNGDRDFIT